MTQDNQMCARIHFMDGTNMVVQYPKQGGHDPTTMASKVRRAIELDKLVFEADGSLFMVPVRNVKFVQITPTPDAIPTDIIRGAHILDEAMV